MGKGRTIPKFRLKPTTGLVYSLWKFKYNFPDFNNTDTQSHNVRKTEDATNTKIKIHLPTGVT